MTDQFTTVAGLTNGAGAGIPRRAVTLILVALLLVLASPGYATTNDMYRVTLKVPYITAVDPEDSEDEIICTYVLQQIRVGSTGIPQVVATRMGVGQQDMWQGLVRPCIDDASVARGAASYSGLTLDVRHGDQIRVAVSLLDTDDDSSEIAILETIRDVASTAQQLSSFVFPAGAQVLGLVATAASITVILWRAFDGLDENDFLGEASYVLDIPVTQVCSASGVCSNANPNGPLTISGQASSLVSGETWNYRVSTTVTVTPTGSSLVGGEFTVGVSPRMRVLSGDFTGDGRTDIAKISMSQGVGAQLTSAFIDVANPDPGAPQRGSSFSINRWGSWNVLREGTQFRVGDVNGDGRADVVAFESYQAGGVWVALSQGGFFTITRWATAYPFYMSPLAHVEVGNFNGDRYSDILMVENGPGNTRNMWLGISDPINSRFNISQAGAVPIDRYSRMLPGDFNGDGKTDVVVFGNSPTSLRFGQVEPPFIFGFLDTFVPTGPREVRAAISNGTNFTVSAWTAWWMTPDINVLAYDFNADGKTDIAQFQNTDWGWGGKVYVGYSYGRPDSSVGSFAAELITRWPEWRDAVGRIHPAMNPFTHVLTGRFDGGPFGSLVRFEPGTPGDVRVTTWPYAGAVGRAALGGRPDVGPVVVIDKCAGPGGRL